MTWYALQHKPSQGDRALTHLQNQGIASFYPKITVEKIKAGKRTKKLEPLFPGYLFVNLEQTDPMWAKLRSTRGILRIVSFANKPAAIPDDVILKTACTPLQSRAASNPVRPWIWKTDPLRVLVPFSKLTTAKSVP
jgi:transcription elongation factor/antiterminator RfaH